MIGALKTPGNAALHPGEAQPKTAELDQASEVSSGHTRQCDASDISALSARSRKRSRSEDDEATPPQRIKLSANNLDVQLAPGGQIEPDGQIEPAGLSAVQLRDNLQDAVQALTRQYDDPSPDRTAALQAEAHSAARNYGATPGTVFDRVIPFAQAVVSAGVGAAGGFAFPGRGLGLAFADAGVRSATGNPELGVIRPTLMPTGASVGIDLGAIGAGYLAGSFFGGAGNFVAQKVFVPTVNNLFCRTLKPVPAEALVPQEMVNLMNARSVADGQTGHGTLLRQAAVAMSKSAAALDSPVNTRFGQLSFGVFTALGVGVPKPALGFQGALAVSGVMSFAGGAGLGALMAGNQMASKIKVPNLALLRTEGNTPTAVGNTAMNPETWCSVPLFYSHQKPMAFAADVSAGFGFASYADMGQVVGYRMAKMARASFTMSAALIVPKLVSLATNEIPVLNPIAAVSAGMGTVLAIPPWFNSLIHQFPANDQAHRPPPANTATNLQPPNPADNPQTANSFAPVTSAEPAIDIEAQQGTFFSANDNVRSI